MHLKASTIDLQPETEYTVYNTVVKDKLIKKIMKFLQIMSQCAPKWSHLSDFQLLLTVLYWFIITEMYFKEMLHQNKLFLTFFVQNDSKCR